ncbi:MAG: hypothetical protein AAF317_07940 [Pseudomonadota bacterium]
MTRKKSSGPGERVIICCYCDSRSLIPRDPGPRLVCHGCGAPVKVIEALEPSHRSRKRDPGVKRQPPRRAKDRDDHAGHHDACRRRKSKKGRKPRGLLYRLHDALDDVLDLDDLFDILD